MWFFRSPNIVFGEDTLSFLNGISQRRILIVTDRNIHDAGLSRLVEKQLPEGSESMVINDIPEEPTLSDIRERLPRINEYAPDLIIGLGGGSSMDAAKALFALYERPDLDVFDITPLVNLNLRKKANLFLVPTTSGTGSECTWAAVLSDENHERKNELASPEIIADYALLDPALVRTMPKGITRNTAVDAITHAIEGRTSQWNNVYSDIFADKAIELITHNLPTVLKNPDVQKARESVHIGASMAGISFSNSQIGLAHAMGHSLGAHFRIPHGMSVGLYLPGIIEFNEPQSLQQYEIMNSKFPEEFRGEKLADTVRNFFRAIGQPLSVAECTLNVKEYEDRLPSLVELAEESTGVVTNSREAGSKDIEKLFTQVMR